MCVTMPARPSSRSLDAIHGSLLTQHLLHRLHHRDIIDAAFSVQLRLRAVLEEAVGNGEALHVGREVSTQTSDQPRFGYGNGIALLVDRKSDPIVKGFQVGEPVRG